MCRRLSRLTAAIAAVTLAGALRPATSDAATPAIAAAAHARNWAFVRTLVAQKVDVNAPEPDGATALHWAANADDVDIARLLIGAGARPDVANDYGVTPLSIAAARGSAGLVDVLLTAGANPNLAPPNGERPLMAAARAGNAAAVRTLLDRGARVADKDPSRGQNALMWAVAAGNHDVVRLLLERGADVQARSASGFSAILFAAREGDLDMARQLLDAGARVNDTDDSGVSPLHAATVRGHAPMALFLLDRGADPRADKPGYTALHWAAAKVELSEYPTRYGTWHEWSVLGGMVDGRMAVVKALLARGADPNAKLTKPTPRFSNEGGGYRALGATPLFMAASNGETETMKVLVAAGADPNARNSDESTVLITAVGRPSGDAQDPIPQAVALEGVKLAIDMGVEINAADKLGETALHTAAYLGHDQVIKYLVEHGASVNQRNKRNETALRIAMGVDRGALRFPGYPAAATMLRSLGGVPE
ncbi:MAG: ankyrin repeat domain-containing protein [Vicinamibacterales bacterium]|nr:ankyrin repeat domain-containing protein [Vicinamibacterales bacterium]